MGKPGLMLILAFILILNIYFISFVSAEILINQPKDLYNLDDPISVPVTIKSSNNVNGFFSMTIICNGKETEIYKEYVFLSAGEEKKMTPSILLMPSLTGVTARDCKIKAILNEDYALTNDFKVSNKISVNLKTEQKEYSPGENILIEGDAIKENGQSVDGYIEITSSINEGQLSVQNQKNTNESENQETEFKITNQNIKAVDTVNNGYFLVNISLPQKTKAGEYQLSIKVYEKNFEGFETNTGTSNLKATVIHIPTSLELIIENEKIEPGTNVRAKAILHDQTGEKIPSTSIITIKDDKDRIKDKVVDKPTDQFHEYFIAKNEPPTKWKVTAVSGEFTSESDFSIMEKREIKAEIINKTLIITNTGNVPYNKTVTVKIGNEQVYLDLNLGVGESEKFKMSAPDGEYDVEVLEDGNSKITGRVMLTGSSIGIKKSSESKNLIKYPLIWIFMILILGFIGFMIFKKGYKRSFIGNANLAPKEKPKKSDLKNSLIERNTAEVSLSLKGDKQPVKTLCLKIKNSEEVKKANGKEVIKNITDAATNSKAVFYENGDYIFFVFSPSITKTLKNEMTAINLAKKAKEVLDNNNRIAKVKIDYGISLNQGEIIAKKEPDTLKIMNLGNHTGASKRIATISKEEILLSEEFNHQIMSNVKTEKQTDGSIVYYSIKEFRGLRDTEDNQKFISNFLSKLERK